MVGFNITERTTPKILINIGALLDIPTSSLVIGKKGETIINGGLGQITGVVGPGNSFKSTVIQYMMLSAASRIFESFKTVLLTYDTENNTSLSRLEALAAKFPNLPENIITGIDAAWTVTDKAHMFADEFANIFGEYVKEKLKDKNSKVIYQAFMDPYTKKELETYIPSFSAVDSITELEASSTATLLEKDIDKSDTNTYAMKQGMFKTKWMSTLPRLTDSSNTCMLMTAHIGTKIDMATGPAVYQQPTKALQYLKSGDALKGVSTKFTFLLSNGWFAHTASVLKNQGTKGPEYPAGPTDRNDTDLNVVKLTVLRSKTGVSGCTVELVVSQTEGVQPALTEFHYIKENNRFGLGGNLVHYSLDLLPEVSLSRTTVRQKLDNDAKLRRAVNISAELQQLWIYNPALERQGLLCTPKELYDDLITQGYDWNVLLQTRGYWTINQYDDPIPFLSTVDLLKMRKNQYFPYFLNEDKTVKEQYASSIQPSIKK